MWILELTVCFESKTVNTHSYKSQKYDYLIDIEAAGYDAHYIALEVQRHR